MRKGNGGPQELGASQVLGAVMALVVLLDHQAVLVPEVLKDFRARRVSEVPLEREWWVPLEPLGPLEREESRGGQGPPGPAGRREKPR